MSEQHIGKVIQITGPVLDIRFPDGQVPALLNAIEIEHDGQKIVVEVAQEIGDNVVRCIAMNSTDGLVRGMDAVDTGAPISVPVGQQCLGRVFNLLGEPVDNKPEQVALMCVQLLERMMDGEPGGMVESFKPELERGWTT